MGIDYINQNELMETLKKFSKGDFFSLFKLVVKNSYDAHDIIKDKNLIINLLSNFNDNQNKEDIINLILDNRINTTEPFIPSEPSIIKKINDYWGEELNNDSPFIMSLIPFATDKQTASLLENSNFSKIENKKHLSELFVLNFFNYGLIQSLESLKSEYFLLTELSRYEKKFKVQNGDNVDTLTLEDLLFDKFLKNPNLLKSYADLFYNSMDYCSDKWMNTKLNETTIDTESIIGFIKQNFLLLSEDGQERIIAQTLTNINNLKPLKACFELLNITDIKDYKPKKYPIWIHSGSHKKKSIFKKLLQSKIDLFDYYPASNRVFISSIVENTTKREVISTLENNGINKKELIKKLFSKNHNEKIDTNNYSLLLATGDTTFNDLLNLRMEDLSLIDKRFEHEAYNSLTLKSKLNLVSDVLNKTFLANTYDVNDSYYSKSIIKKEINFNLWIDSEYNLNRNSETIHLVNEHLSLLEQFEPTEYNGNYDFRKTYFKSITQMFDFYSIQNLKEESPFYNLYSKIIDYVSTDKSLNWKSILDHISEVSDKKTSFNDGAQNILSYLHKVALNNSFETSIKENQRKVKI